MPRKSKDQRELAPYTQSVRSYLAPPEGCSKAVAKEWRELMTRVPAGHFVAGDTELIRRYVECALLLRSKGLATGDWINLTRCQASLATRLRLTPASRRDRGRPSERTPTVTMSADDFLASMGE